MKIDKIDLIETTVRFSMARTSGGDSTDSADSVALQIIEERDSSPIVKASLTLEKFAYSVTGKEITGVPARVAGPVAGPVPEIVGQKRVIVVSFNSKRNLYSASFADRPGSYILAETMDKAVRNLCNALSVNGTQLAADYVVQYVPSPSVIEELR